MKLSNILRLTQPALKRELYLELKGLGYSPIAREGFLYAEGDLPVMLVAHLDTVHKEPVKVICTSHKGDILMSPQGIGGDDRAGVYMILEIIKEYQCHVLFCEDEECGAIGAREFTRSPIKPEINFIVELDRRGEKDAVFYDCDNPEFTEFVTSFGFEEEIGSFSDISVIAPHLEVAAVNISAGYYHEHTLHEHINLKHLHTNIQRVKKLVSTDSPKFEYIEAYRGFWPRLLSPTPRGAFLRNEDGEMEETDDYIWMDELGGAYHMFDDEGVAIPLHDVQVFSPQGLPARFDRKRSAHVDVLMDDFYY